MSKITGKAARVAGFTVALGATATLASFAATGTGAYFSDAKTGNTIAGTMGSIAITGHDGQGPHHLDISFADMLPGDAASKTVGFTNTGNNPEDVWVVFNQKDLGTHDGQTGLNSFGTFGEVHVASSGTAIFGSKNLNDDAATCPPGAGPAPVCNPLPHMLKLDSNLAPGASGSMTFAFTPSAKFKSVQNVELLHLGYTLVATQHGIAPDNSLNSTVVN
jgi:hypothetical protein